MQHAGGKDADIRLAAAPEEEAECQAFTVENKGPFQLTRLKKSKFFGNEEEEGKEGKEEEKIRRLNLDMEAHGEKVGWSSEEEECKPTKKPRLKRALSAPRISVANSKTLEGAILDMKSRFSSVSVYVLSKMPCKEHPNVDVHRPVDADGCALDLYPSNENPDLFSACEADHVGLANLADEVREELERDGGKGVVIADWKGVTYPRLVARYVAILCKVKNSALASNIREHVGHPAHALFKTWVQSNHFMYKSSTNRAMLEHNVRRAYRQI